MLIILYILLILSSPFILHFLLLPLSKKLSNNKNIVDLFYIKHFSVSATYDKNLMIRFYQKSMIDSFESIIINGSWTKTMVIVIGGFYLTFYYGHKAVPNYAAIKNYGFCCVDNETFWRSIEWGKHYFNNPFAPCKYIAKYVYDFDNVKLITTDDASNNCFLAENYPYFMEIINGTYINEDQTKVKVPNMKWCLNEMTWSCPILIWLKMPLAIRRRVYLEFNCEKDGDPQFNGIGVIQNDYKGGTYGASIELNDIPELYKMYIDIAHKNHFHNFHKFVIKLNKLINDFMWHNKQDDNVVLTNKLTRVLI